MAKKDQPKIPKLEIEKFTFSPPGPMGWSFSEYDKLLDRPEEIVLNETNINQSLSDIENSNLVELPFNKQATNGEVLEVENIDSPPVEVAYPADYSELEVPSYKDLETVTSHYEEESSELFGLDSAVVLEDESIESEPESVTVLEEEPDPEPVPEPEPEPKKPKKRIIIVTMDPPKPPWISPALHKRK